MLPDAVVLSKSVRRDLVQALEKLGSPDATERASAAQRAADLVQKRGAIWSQVIIPGVPDEAVSALGVWPAPVLALLEHPCITAEDRATLRRLAAWRAPGRAGMALVKEIQARVSAGVGGSV